MNDLTLQEIQDIKERCKDSNKGWFEGGLTIYNCPVCQKNFVVHDVAGWVYKRRTRSFRKNERVLYFCSYGCVRKHDKVFE